jgi:8-oxo-dGTP pyrophosphatase MutT (NUDIX family)
LNPDPNQPFDRRGVVAVILREGKLLVIRRGPRIAAPGRICFPGGAIEPGESEEVALVRELQEELSVEVKPVRRLWESVTSWRVHLAWWLADMAADAEPIPHPEEVAAIYWLTPAELRAAPEILESNVAFLDAWEAGLFRL